MFWISGSSFAKREVSDPQSAIDYLYVADLCFCKIKNNKWSSNKSTRSVVYSIVYWQLYWKEQVRLTEIWISENCFRTTRFGKQRSCLLYWTKVQIRIGNTINWLTKWRFFNFQKENAVQIIMFFRNWFALQSGLCVNKILRHFASLLRNQDTSANQICHWLFRALFRLVKQP